MKKIFSVFVVAMLNCMAYSQNFTLFQVGESRTYHIGSTETLGSHFSSIGIQTNYVRVTALSRGTGTIYLRTGSNEYLKCVDVVSIVIAESLPLICGESYTYSPIITDAEAKTTLTWSSSDPSVATIDENGTMTALSPGYSIITCTASNGVSAQSTVTVSPLLVNSVLLNTLRHDMNVGDSLKLGATLFPVNATNKTVYWFTSNENIAQVDKGGNVVAIAPGYCSIYAKASDGSGKYEKCLVHVLGAEAVQGDMDGDGKVTMTDAVKVIDIILER